MGGPLAVVGTAAFHMLTSMAVGLMQWWVLSVYYPSPLHGWRWWAPAGIVGLGAPLTLYALIWGDTLYGPSRLPAVALGGALAGVLQQRILRRLVARSWWWVPASTAGWALAIASPFLFGQLLSFEAVGPYVYLLSSALQGFVLALVTGSVLVTLPDLPAQPPAAEGAAGREPSGVRLWICWAGLTTLGWLIGSLYSIMGFGPPTTAMTLVCLSAGVALMRHDEQQEVPVVHRALLREGTAERPTQTPKERDAQL